ncbi:uncharacterized protein EV422DRAFT_223174 [Fimicolochytrium jonesii]|uniref:uncharacterized protein n=1 Tax=Fimicolochytrium jonesii TaxID=1396493 RepID=UPI0022FEEDF6|nr:uncharacterized protein EV422DRAFT_223174 [Fimicolochytrium jonesii]KAI8817400.1 hypothetical protein EV422DRAFT_223174 [Fimicolochytrium jonesii]
MLPRIYSRRPSPTLNSMNAAVLSLRARLSKFLLNDDKMRLFGIRFAQKREAEYHESLLADRWLSRITKVVGVGILAHWGGMMLLTHFNGQFQSTYTWGVDFGLLGPLSVVAAIGSFRKDWQKSRIWDFLLMLNSVAWVVVALIEDHRCRNDPVPECATDNYPTRANEGLYITFGPFIQLYIFNTHKGLYGFVLFLTDLYLGILVFMGDSSQFTLYILITVFQIFMFIFAIILDNHRRTSFKLQVDLNNEILETKRVEEKKRQLTGYVFHEIRVPLNTLIQSVNLLEKGGAKDYDASLIEVLNTGLRSIETLLNDVLDFQKIAEGFFQLNPQPCDIHQSILTVVHVMAASANAKGVIVSTNLDLNVPRCIVLDDFRFRQVLANLISNAIKFTPERKAITVETAVVGPSNGETVEVYVGVSDEGIGISAENIAKLFKPWVQIDAQLNQGGKGSGLGLAICANIIQAIGGTYGIESTVGAGSTFWFRFSAKTCSVGSKPASRTPSSSKNSPILSAKATALTIAAKSIPLHILIVDDDKISRMMMQRIMKSLGHTADIASDGQEVVDLFGAYPKVGECPFDAMFIDNFMPRMNGTEAIKWLRSHGWSELLIVSTSGVSLVEEERSIYDAGANKILRKPISIDVVRDTLEWIGKSRRAAQGRPGGRGITALSRSQDVGLSAGRQLSHPLL